MVNNPNKKTRIAPQRTKWYQQPNRVLSFAGSRRLGFKIFKWLGAKNASLKEMFRELPSKGVKVRNRFTIDRPSSMLGSRKF